MALSHLHYFSPALGMQTAATVLLPEGEILKAQRGPLPVLYLLHGLSDNHTRWQRYTSIERYVEGLSLIVVMPDGGRGFYCDAHQGFAYETAIAGDLVSYIDRVFNTRAEREGRCIGGLSMGGYGAVKLALRFPEMFCSAHSHSGALQFGHLPMSDRGPEFDAEFARVLGPKYIGGVHDLFALAKRLKPALRPALKIDCGVDDLLIEHNRTFHAHLKKLKFPHEYEEFPGAHNWAYWDEHIQEAIRFHARHLGIEVEPRG